MKYIKGLVVFVVVCLALYGAVMLFKKPPQLNVTEDERNYLRDMGIHIQNTEASDSGLSAVLGDVEGVEPIGAFDSSSVSSSAPPNFFGEPAGTPTSTTVPPPFLAEPVSKIATPVAEPVIVESIVAEPQPLSGFSPPSASPAASEQSADLSSQSPASVESPFEVHSVEPPSAVIPEPEKTPFVTMPIESPPVSAMESPPRDSPIIEENWDGPVSWIPVTPPPAETLSYTTPLPANTPPRPEYNADHFPVANSPIVDPPVTEAKVRRIFMDSNLSNPSADHSLSATDAEPPVETTSSAQPYVMTNVRKPITFETMKPESSSNDPSISFAPSKHGYKTGQTARQQATKTPPPSANSGQTENREELRIVSDPSDTPKFSDPASLKQFIQSQQMLAKSGNPESIRTAFVRLSQFYEENRFDDSICVLVRPILNRLALDVIYSKDRHILEPPYQVKLDETVESVSKDFGLTPALLRKINGLSPTQELTAGTTLKVVFGQFDARISVKRKELTLLLGGLYAGQFRFSMPPSINTSAYSGEFFIALRTGQTLVLNNGLIIGRAGEKNTAFMVTDQDAREIFDILAEQSVIILE